MSYQYRMTQYNTLYVKLANSQFHKLKSEIKKDASGTLIFLLNIISSEKTKFLLKLLLANTQVSKNCKSFSNGFSANIKFQKLKSII